MGLIARNLSSGFPSKRVSNQSPQLQRLARKNKISLVASLYMGLSKTKITKALNRDAQAGLRLCCSQTSEDRFSRVEANIRTYTLAPVKYRVTHICFISRKTCLQGFLPSKTQTSLLTYSNRP